MLIVQHHEPERFGVVDVDDEGRVIDAVEKPKNPRSNLVSAGPMVLNEGIFAYEPEKHESGELVLSLIVRKMAKDHDIYTEATDF